jgi:sugar phosphate isomerase/epimerase
VQLAFSNLAWPPELDDAAGRLLTDTGFTGVELAPTKYFPRPTEATPVDVRAVRKAWEGRGLRVVALQALLFGQPDLTLFDEAGPREAAVAYLSVICRLGADLGAGSLVFGSPANRATRGRPPAEVDAIAADVFGRVGAVAAACGVCFCIEHNPPEYGCDFATTADEAAALVRRVGSPGFGLHLDLGGLVLSGDDVPGTVGRLAGVARHCHASEPNLAPFGDGTADLTPLAAALRSAEYGGWVSVEMKPAVGAELAAVAKAAARLASAVRASSQAA